jgi:hypothetical protein
VIVRDTTLQASVATTVHFVKFLPPPPATTAVSTEAVSLYRSNRLPFRNVETYGSIRMSSFNVENVIK